MEIIDYSLIEPSLAFLGAVIGGVTSLIAGDRANKSSAKEAAQGRLHSNEQMQNRHQWQVEDLRKAGLNPILSAHSAPSIGSSPTAQQQNPAQSMGSAMQAGMELDRHLAQQDLIKSQTVQAQTQGVKNLADAKVAGNIESVSRPIANLASSAHQITKDIGKDVGDFTSGTYNSAKKAMTSPNSPGGLLVRGKNKLMNWWKGK